MSARPWGLEARDCDSAHCQDGMTQVATWCSHYGSGSHPGCCDNGVGSLAWEKCAICNGEGWLEWCTACDAPADECMQWAATQALPASCWTRRAGLTADEIQPIGVPHATPGMALEDRRARKACAA